MPERSRPARRSDDTDLAPYRARLKRLRGLAKSAGFSHLLITNPIDVGYLTGFLGGDSYLLLGATDAAIISDFRYEEELEPLKPMADIVIRRGPISGALAARVADAKVERLGLQIDHLTVEGAETIAKAIASAVKGGRKLVGDTQGLIAQMRVVKDDAEVALIRKAIQIQQKALEALLPQLKPGQTEMEVAARLEFEMKTRGSAKPGFESIIAARANGSLPHYRPSPKVKLAANQPLLIDWGATWMGYHGDMTRTFSFGKWPTKVREIYEIVLEAHEKSAAAIAPGKLCRDIDAVARDHIVKAGYGEQFGHGLGHGIGLNGHEDPRLSHMASGDARLAVGMVVTIEPGIYIPGVGGVRIEDDYLITDKGAKNLCTLPRSLEWSTLA